MPMNFTAKAPAPTALEPHLQLLRGSGRETDPLAMLSMLRSFKAEIEKYETSCVRSAREAGASWAEVGAAVGQARQNAQRKWGHHG